MPVYPISSPPQPTRAKPLPSVRRDAPVKSVSHRTWTLFGLALTLIVLEGAIRKWILNSESSFWAYLVYFSKDAAFAGLLLFPSLSPGSPALSRFRRWLVLGSAVFILGAGISLAHGLNAVGALLTVRATLLLPWLALFAAARLQRVHIRRIAALLGLLTTLNFALSTFQNRLPPDHFLNRYSATDSTVVVLDSGVRATGTFSYITGLGLISSVGVWAGLVLLSVARDGRWQIVGGLVIVAGFGCGLASISRGPLVINLAMLGLWLPLAWRRVSLNGGAALVVLAGIVFAAWGAGLLPEMARMAKAVVARHQTAEDTVWGRTFFQLIEGTAAAVHAPFGTGLGTEQTGGNYALNRVRSFTTFENQLPRLVLETGVLGLMGFVLICGGAIASLQLAKRRVRDPGLSAALLATQLLLLPLFYANVVFNHTGSAFAWMLFAAALCQVGRDKCSPAVTPPSSSRNFPCARQRRLID